MRLAYLCCSALLLAGCASVHKTYAPDGREAFALNCSGHARGWDKCQAKAGELCGSRGYDILSGNSESGAVASVNRNGGFASTTQERSMLVACKAPAP